MRPAVHLAATLTRLLPAADTERLARAVDAGAGAVAALRAEAGSPLLRSACDEVRALGTSGELSGALRAAAAVRLEDRLAVDVVWGGPESPAGAGRLTSAVITESVDGARETVLVVGYAVHEEPSVVDSLQRAVTRGVEITLVCERPSDNPRFNGTDRPFPGLSARRLAWPAGTRPAGASLHAKVLVVDAHTALVGSANLTGAALGRNLECGLLVSGGAIPTAVSAHVDGLLSAGQLVRV